jgi:hypothetical protein
MMPDQIHSSMVHRDELIRELGGDDEAMRRCDWHAAYLTTRLVCAWEGARDGWYRDIVAPATVDVQAFLNALEHAGPEDRWSTTFGEAVLAVSPGCPQ